MSAGRLYGMDMSVRRHPLTLTFSPEGSVGLNRGLVLLFGAAQGGAMCCDPLLNNCAAENCFLKNDVLALPLQSFGFLFMLFIICRKHYLFFSV